MSVRRVLTSLGAGIVTAAGAWRLGFPELSPLLGWGVTATVGLAWVWLISWPKDHHDTKRLATEEGDARSTDTGVLIGAVASLGAVALALVRTASHTPLTTALVILSVVTVIVSWSLVNTVFAFKYARLYYVDEDGGIDFGQEDPPAYSDFAYLAFTIGVTFGVTDNHVVSTHIRKVALAHALLPYFFNTGILAVAINLVTDLSQ
ncbi:Uncharacterized membrane protein [Nonomuraea solani]|uniref:Uncharacterized membrane protein n=1 Tax=Nonomuraea solani TaxID=1144553 RepID=A0A1H6EHJ3_9ACTN|nr:DUF1345 domain-containing protein [Nonomuraea solani]SEG96305.1 Uncharacterized membrane protein [Nonomuraea solani]